MALQLGKLLGAAANLTTAFSEEKSVKSFLERINDFGVQVTNNFEVNFSGLEDITFFVQDIKFSGIKMQIENVYYDGRSIPIPIGIYDYDHNGTMTIINDANGYIYAAITAFLMDGRPKLVNNGYTMTIKCLTGDSNYRGSVITLRGVLLESVDGLDFNYSGGDISKINVGFQYRDFDFTPGALATASGVVGALNNIIS